VCRLTRFPSIFQRCSAVRLFPDRTIGMWAAVAFILVVALVSGGWAQSLPAFSTQAPMSGKTDSQFVVLLPLFNIGTVGAANVEVTSATLGLSQLNSPALPVSVGTLSAGDHSVLDLQFNASNLILGANYLLTVRGTYEVGTQKFGFAVNRFLKVTIPSNFILTQLQHWMVLDAVRIKFDSLPRLDPVSDNQTMLDFIRSRPEFADSGIDVASSSVWATFTNGEQIGIANDRKGGATNLAARQAADAVPAVSKSTVSPVQKAQTVSTPSSGSSFEPTELPLSSTVHLMNSLSSLSFLASEALTDIASMLKKPQNYKVTELDPTVDNLKNFPGGDGVFYFASHGGFVGKGTTTDPKRYGVWTSTKADAFTDNTLFDDVFGTTTRGPTLVRFLAERSTDLRTMSPITEYHYAINALFVTTYFKPFSNASFVYIDACSSDAASASIQAFKSAFFGKNASVYAGWTDDMNDRVAANSARLVFDRLLGANEFFLETIPTASGGVFKQRPFDWHSVEGDLPLHGLGFSDNPVPGAFLHFTQAPNSVVGGVFAALTPSIAATYPDESQDQLLLLGSFGSDMGTVSVGGVALAGCTWDSSFLKCPLPSSGDGAAGNVVVTVRNHISNVARLTEWRGTFRYLVRGVDTLNQTIDFDVAFRADLREWRPLIHEAPIEPMSGPIEAISPGSSAGFVCGGTGTTFPNPNESDTFTWTGSGNLSFNKGIRKGQPPPGPNWFWQVGALQGSHKKMLMTFTVNRQYMACTQAEHVVVLKPPGKFDFGPDPLGLCFPGKNLILDLGNDASIQPPPVPVPFGDVGCGPGQSQGSLRWGRISATPGTEPDLSSAR
jgi:hypothetical protein